MVASLNNIVIYHDTIAIYCGILIVGNVGTAVNYRGIFLTLAPGACILKLITAVMDSFRNKLECLSLNTRLGWKGLPGTNTLAYYGNRKLRP
jgi:hypothetical protein